MAEHKVPQDVEADDKLIGPFSFRQFVYLMVAFGGCALAFFMATKISPVLAVIPAPVVIFFGALALPLRKDQPMETYIAALVRYYLLKPRVRIWKADGEGSLIEISNPTIDETPKTKDLAGDEVSRRLSFLASVSDSQGWSTRGLDSPISNTNLNDEYASDAVNAPDMMDDSAVSDAIDHKLDQSEKAIRQAAIDKMNNAVANSSADVTYVQAVAPPAQSNTPGYNYQYQSYGYEQPQQYAAPATQIVEPVQYTQNNFTNSVSSTDSRALSQSPNYYGYNYNESTSVAPSGVDMNQNYYSVAPPTPEQPAPQPLDLSAGQLPNYSYNTNTNTTNTAPDNDGSLIHPEPAIINSNSANANSSSNDTTLIGSDGGVIDVKLH